MEHWISLIFFNEKMGEFEGWKQGINKTYILFKPKGKFWIYFNKEKVSKRKQKSTLPQSCPPFYVQIWLLNAWASIRPGVDQWKNHANLKETNLERTHFHFKSRQNFMEITSATKQSFPFFFGGNKAARSSFWRCVGSLLGNSHRRLAVILR